MTLLVPGGQRQHGRSNCTAYAPSRSPIAVCKPGRSNKWPGPAGAHFRLWPKRDVNEELGVSHTLLPVTHTTDRFTRYDSMIWMYYGRGCSDFMWCPGRTLGGVHKLQVAAALKRLDDPSCDLDCAARFFSELSQRVPIPVNTSAALMRYALEHTQPRYTFDGRTLQWYRLAAACEDAGYLNLWLHRAARRHGYDSLQFYASPGCPPPDAAVLPPRFPWATELVDLRHDADGSGAFQSANGTRRWAHEYIRCRGKPCQLTSAFARDRGERVGSCLACVGCSGSCNAPNR